MNKKILAGLLVVAGLSGALFAAINSGFPYANQTWQGYGNKRNIVQFTIRALTEGASSDLVPGVTNTNALGSTSLRFSGVYSVLLNATGNFTLGAAAAFITSPATVQSLSVATTGISPSAAYVLVGSSGPITNVATPTITTSGATNGQWVTIKSTAALITIQDADTLASSGLELNAVSVVIGTSTPRSFIFDSATTRWVLVQ